jgi:hypothetical protein
LIGEHNSLRIKRKAVHLPDLLDAAGVVQTIMPTYQSTVICHSIYQIFKERVNEFFQKTLRYAALTII